MNRIKLNIECRVGEYDSDEISNIKKEVEFREGYIMIDKILMFYQEANKQNSIIELTEGSIITVNESIKQIDKLIEDSNMVIVNCN